MAAQAAVSTVGPVRANESPPHPLVQPDPRAGVGGVDRVLVLYDVDGVLAPMGAPPPDLDMLVLDLPQGRFWFDRALLEVVHLLAGTPHGLGSITAGAGASVGLPAVECAWLSSWQEDAALDLGPALGLPRWATHTKEAARRSHGWEPGLSWWKEAVVAWYLRRGRWVVWCDDDIDEYGARRLVEAFPRLRVLCPDRGRGLDGDALLSTIREVGSRSG